MGKIKEIFKQHPKSWTAAGVALALTAAIGIPEWYGYSQNPTEAMRPDSCESPLADTGAHKGINTSNFSLYSGTGEGVVVTVQVPEGAYGVRGAFKGTEADASWQKSNVVPVNPSTKEAKLKFAVGQGAVRFGVSVVALSTAELNEPACAKAPTIDTQYLSNGFSSADGNHPWPNPLNVILS